MHMNNKSTVFLQNIISPYRARFFNKLNEKYDDFSLYYMGETEPDKYWDVSKIEMHYDHWIDRHGLCLKLSKTFMVHLNPVLLYRIFRSKSIKNVVLAVSWNDPTIFFILLMRRLHLTSKRLFFWAEANCMTNGSRKENWLKLHLKRFAYGCVDGALIIPGKMSVLSFEKWGVKPKNLIFLPNVINDSGLKYDPDNQRSRNETPVFIMPMRIFESVKGGLNFFRAIGEENVRKAVFYVCGDGEDMEMYKNFIREHRYEEHIIMKGFCDAETMTRLYNISNGFILPSFSDSSPLSMIEALNLHMPILCSSHCGNHFEAVEEGENGYTFSPLDPAEIKAKFERFLSDRDRWTEMGETSARLYRERFETDMVVTKFVEQFNRYKKE